MSEENGAIIVPVYTNLGGRQNSYSSHTSRISYNSHGDLLNGKLSKDGRLKDKYRGLSANATEVTITLVKRFDKSMKQSSFDTHIS